MALGTISPGGYATITFYVKNNGNINLTLSLYTTNWNPTNANGPITVTWNLEGTVLLVNQSSAATLTVSVSPDIEGITTFSLDAVITGTE